MNADELGRALLSFEDSATLFAREARQALDLIDDLEPYWQQARDAYRDELAATVHHWMAAHALIGEPHVMFGSVVDELRALAIASQAAMIVVGSRRLGTVGRIFLGSTASALAARASCPVAVVPSP